MAEERTRFAVARPLRLMFQDEARFGRISDVRHCWQKKPHRPVVKAMVTQQYVYAYGAISPADGRFDSLILPQVNGKCMQLFLDEVARRYPDENIVMVLDGAGWHKSPFQLADNLRLIFLPPYAPELNPQNTCGMSCARSTSTTEPSIAWRPWKPTWNRALLSWKTSRERCRASPAGNG